MNDDSVANCGTDQKRAGNKMQIFLICSAIGLCVLGFLAFLLTRDVRVLTPFTIPLLAIIARANWR